MATGGINSTDGMFSYSNQQQKELSQSVRFVHKEFTLEQIAGSSPPEERRQEFGCISCDKQFAIGGNEYKVTDLSGSKIKNKWDTQFTLSKAFHDSGDKVTWKAVDASYTVKKNLTVVMNKKLTRAAKETYKIVLVQLPNVEDQVQSCGENELGLEKDTIILVPHAPSNAKEMRASYYTSSTVTIVFC